MASKSSSRKVSTKPPSATTRGEPKQPDDPVVQVRLISADVEAFKKFVETTPLDFSCAGPRVNAEGLVTAHVLMKKSVALRAAKAGVLKVEITADPSTRKTNQQADIGKGNRFADPRVLPTGRGVLLRKPS